MFLSWVPASLDLNLQFAIEVSGVWIGLRIALATLLSRREYSLVVT